MKKIAVALSVFALFASCKKNVAQTQVTKTEDSIKIEKQNPELTIDSLLVHDSAKISKNLSAEFRQKLLTFEGLEKKVLDSLYFGELLLKDQPMEDFSKEKILQRMNDNMKNYFAETKTGEEDFVREYKQTWDQISDMKVFSKTKDYLTIQYNGYGFSGGAHGYGYDLYKVVDLKNQSVIQLSDLIDSSKITWKPILLKHVDREMLFDENITANNNFYFDSNSLTFIYNQYEIGPYAAGIIEIKVPFSEIKQALKPEFKKRLNIN
ncbi:DUF3298 and DUF4163 domain-containing protein [Chryseobacterium sp. Leaf394]|uniref:DUF3298 and DUF4163 domain-containing protein n=1 Tax=Chryseobacterium sp. Leaf394 TaxID=1736361 RepID=UPI0006FF75DB|nr:DUF3298 and DUF4163 domain-containing protein [Chryseobacterium sp. Leaf394]KQS92164.1 hypothetical protein ASG21_06865 [Chryseobacterium sp. Leaf394]